VTPQFNGPSVPRVCGRWYRQFFILHSHMQRTDFGRDDCGIGAESTAASYRAICFVYSLCNEALSKRISQKDGLIN
jgi:hypothetical protein